jgi:hypothetical protein
MDTRIREDAKSEHVTLTGSTSFAVPKTEDSHDYINPEVYLKFALERHPLLLTARSHVFTDMDSIFRLFLFV